MDTIGNTKEQKQLGYAYNSAPKITPHNRGVQQEGDSDTMTTLPTRIAILGLGAAARNIHLPAYRKLTDIEIVGGYDPVAPEKGQFDFPVFTSPDQLIDTTKPDIVAIACPTPFHFELTQMALNRDCHVFCEKPFTTTIEEAKSLIELAKSKQRWIVINNEFRFMNIYEAAKEKIGSAEFGELLFVNAQQMFHVNAHTEAGWRGDDPQRTCKEFGIHVLDLCRYFFGAEPIRIDAKMPKPGNPNGPDYLNIIRLDFADGKTAQITLDRLTKGRHRYLDMRLDGTHGAIETELGGNITFSAGIRGGDRKPFVNFDVSMGGRALLYQAEASNKIATDPLDIFANATAKLMARFISALKSGGTPDCCAQDNIKTLALMLAAYDSAHLGQPVEFASQWL
ncbi:MAG: hypothetical protein CMK83_07730 [Pseudomonadales bacterium]|jgi:D-apiose dehydrogenase|nr:hypothetical protein [Pseudomonadales bacterium]TNC88411.1 MAG: hypothetical protein CSH49_11615 [Alcanivorax sp.]HAG96732.1 hypothetical protein [Gammaproteobacteria bacterium]HBO95785.1 hypothetical protein [Gammaproteobacteria bacterium]|tara:strand:+ start:15269 stop:16453 length:1185 start_codon:yes stop_codon:yes gene_type:complete